MAVSELKNYKYLPQHIILPIHSTKDNVDNRKNVKNLPFPIRALITPSTIPLAVDGSNEFKNLPTRSPQTLVFQSTINDHLDARKIRRNIPTPSVSSSEWTEAALVPMRRLRSPVIYCYKTEYVPPLSSFSPPIKRVQSKAISAKQLKLAAKHRCRHLLTVAPSGDGGSGRMHFKMEQAIRNAKLVERKTWLAFV